MMDDARDNGKGMSPDAPDVSVVMIFLNGERFIREAIESVLGQTFQSLELLLCDDGSSDGSTDIAKAFVELHPDRVRYLEHEGHINKGMSAARNLGIAHSRGSYIAFIDCDDVWRPQKLAEQIAIMRRHPDVGVVCGAANYWSSWEGREDRIVLTGHVQDCPVLPPDASLALYPLGQACAPCPSDLLVRRAVVEKAGGFEERFRAFYEDQGFLAKVYLHCPVYFASKVWLDYRQHDTSCMALTGPDAYHAARREFLDWFGSYLTTLPGGAPGAVMQAWRRANWPYRHPVLHRASMKARSLLRIVTRSLKPAPHASGVRHE